MKLIVLTTFLLAVFLFTGCDKPETITPKPLVQANTFNGNIFGETISYTAGKDNVESRSGLWMGGGESYAELGLETSNQTADALQFYVNSKIVPSPLTATRFKELFAVGTKSAEHNFAGYHIIFHKDGKTYSSVGGEQPANFLEVIKLEELPNNPQYQEFNFKVAFKINCNLYKYGAPHEYAGKIENGKLIAYYLR